VRNVGQDFVQIGEPRYLGIEFVKTLGGG